VTSGSFFHEISMLLLEDDAIQIRSGPRMTESARINYPAAEQRGIYKNIVTPQAAGN